MRGSLRWAIVSELNELMTETSRTISQMRCGRRARGREDAIVSLTGGCVGLSRTSAHFTEDMLEERCHKLILIVFCERRLFDKILK